MNAQSNVLTSNCCVDNVPSSSITTVTQNLLKRVLQFLIERRRQRINRLPISDLLSLDDNMLKDLGLTRGDIQWAGKVPSSINAAAELEILARRSKRRH